MGFEGEGYLDESVWIVKSHYPERVGRCVFEAQKAIIIVRNPLDCIFSLFNMVGTLSHNASLPEKVIKYAMEKTDLWTDFIR